MLRFVPVRNVSKSAQVFERLRNAIWAGELAPGTPLKEAHLARELHVSQVPVREALLQLENLGLVLRIPDRGTYVTKLTRTEMEQLLSVRCHLEELAFHLAARNMTSELEAKLRSLLALLEERVKANDHFGVAEVDLKFHEAVWNASGNAALEKTLDRLCISIYAFVSMKRHAAGEKLVPVSHEVLLDALLSRDARLITRRIREHLSPESTIPANIAD